MPVLEARGDDAVVERLPILACLIEVGCVQDAGRGLRDVVLINPGDGVMRAGPFELTGEGAALRYRGGEIDDMLAIGDSEVKISEG